MTNLWETYVKKNLKVGIEMADAYIDPNVKRSKTLILWSALYLGACWISTAASFLNPDAAEFKATDLLSLFLIPTTICALIYTFRWVRSNCHRQIHSTCWHWLSAGLGILELAYSIRMLLDS